MISELTQLQESKIVHHVSSETWCNKETLMNLTDIDKYLLERAVTLDNDSLATLMSQCDENREEDRFINIILNIYYYCNLLQEFNNKILLSNEKLSQMMNEINTQTTYNYLYEWVQRELNKEENVV